MKKQRYFTLEFYLSKIPSYFIVKYIRIFCCYSIVDKFGKCAQTPKKSFFSNQKTISHKNYKQRNKTEGDKYSRPPPPLSPPALVPCHHFPNPPPSIS